MATLKYLPQYFATTLNVGGGIDSSQTTGIVLQSVSGVDITKPGQVCISYSDPLDTGVAEWINYTSINGSNELVGVTRGCEGYSAHSHLPGAVIQFTMSATHLNDLNDIVNGIQGKNIVTTAGGTTTYTLTPSPAITAYATGQEFVIKMNATNTGASTINVSALGAKSLTKGGATALASGDLLIDAVYKIVYDGTQFQVSGINGATAATQAEVATGTSNTLMATPLGVSRWHMPPAGFLYNGKIVPSVASNNLTVALKGIDGNDPSATNPVYVRIGNAIQSITSALSLTANAGSNYLNLGSAELATKETDLFVYLWMRSSEVRLAISRIPYANLFDDFTNSSTAEKGWIASNSAGSSSGDEFVNIGRFAATLSAGAGYTWTVPTFTAANLIQRPIFNTRWLTWTPSVTWTGGAAPTTPTTSARYVITNRSMYFYFRQGNSGAGTTNTRVTISIPMVAQNVVASETNNIFNGAVSTGAPGVAPTTTPTAAYLYGDYLPIMDFTSISAKSAFISGTYEI